MCLCIILRIEYYFINIPKTITYYLLHEPSYHKSVRVDKETFKKIKSCLYVVLQKGEIREGSLEKKREAQIFCKRNPFCLKPLASYRTSVIWQFLSKLVGFCLSLILCRNICYRAVLFFSV